MSKSVEPHVPGCRLVLGVLALLSLQSLMPRATRVLLNRWMSEMLSVCVYSSSFLAYCPALSLKLVAFLEVGSFVLLNSSCSETTWLLRLAVSLSEVEIPSEVPMRFLQSLQSPHSLRPPQSWPFLLNHKPLKVPAVSSVLAAPSISSLNFVNVSAQLISP